jgi:hypothetical protein
MGEDEFRVQCLAFTLLRRFLACPYEFEALERAFDKCPVEFGTMLLELMETLPQPFTDRQFALALGLSRFLVGYDERDIPMTRRIRVRRLMIVAS